MTEGFLAGKEKRQGIRTMVGQPWFFCLSCISTSSYLGPSVLPYPPLQMGESTTKSCRFAVRIEVLLGAQFIEHIKISVCDSLSLPLLAG